MDFPDLPTGLALFAVAAAAVGVVARQRKRGGVDTHRDDASDAEPPAPVGAAPAHQVAAQAVIENARAGAAAVTLGVENAQDETAPAPLSQFDGNAWATTVPMDGMVAEPQFADTMPADGGFAETLPAPIGFGHTHFADTQVTELVAEERPGAVAGLPR